MPRYIDAEPIENFITDGLNNKEKSYGWVGVEILTEVHYTQTADVAPVVHGHWILVNDYGNPFIDPTYECSICKQLTTTPRSEKFCHNCGAKMERVKGNR